MLKPEEADQYKSFRVQHPDVQGLLDVRSSGLEYLSFNDIASHLTKIEEQVNPIFKAEQEKTSSSENRTPYQKDLVHLYNSLVLYNRLRNTLQPESWKVSCPNKSVPLPSPAASRFCSGVGAFKAAMCKGLPAVQSGKNAAVHGSEDVQALVQFFRRYQELDGLGYALVIPPLNPDVARDDWRNLGRSLLESMKSGEVHPAVGYFARMAGAYQRSAPGAFNEAVKEYRDWLQGKGLVREINKGQREFYFNHLQPFYKAMVIYVAALLFGCASWLKLSEWVRRSAFYLLILAFGIHTLGLVFRMFLEGRPPVTNLYSSAIFVGWGAVLLGIILERIYRDGIGTVASSAIGFSTQIIAHHLALGGDTMEMLRAVLDTNFWLATHVVMITVGYSSMFFAGFLAILYVLRGFFTRSLTETVAKSLAPWSTASFVSLRYSALLARSSAVSGPTNPGADSGDGTRRKTALC